jgi:putrescine transport system substrate-binding protein
VRSLARQRRAATCLVLLLLAAGAAADEAPVVNVYNWADYMGPTTLADFEAETGIAVNYDTYDSSEIVEAKLLAGSTGYDVVLHGAQYASRLIPIGVFQRLDRSRIPSWRQLDPRVLAKLAEFDPGNLYGAPFMWGSTGFAYNVEMIRERIPEAAVGSGDMIFDPEVVGKIADCGVTFLDSPTEVIPMALVYLGRDANSIDPEDLRAAEALLRAVRPLIKYINSTRMLMDLPNQEVCVAMSWSGDYARARANAAEAGIDVDLAYTVPSEGSVSWFDVLVIPADAPHPDNAHRFIDFLLRPEVIAAISNETRYANPVKTARPLGSSASIRRATWHPSRSACAPASGPGSRPGCSARRRDRFDDRPRRPVGDPLARSRGGALRPAGGAVEALRRLHRGGPGRPLHLQGGALLDPGRVRMRQDDAAAHAGRPGGAERGEHPHRRRRRHGPAALRAARQHHVPVLRALPPHDGRAERGLRPEEGGGAGAPDPGARR